MPIGATIAAATVTAGATVYSSSKASSAAKKAVAAETQSNNDALNLQRDMYNQQRADYEPWRQVGIGALQQLAPTFNISVPAGTWSGQTTTPAPTPVGSGTVAGQGSTATATTTAQPNIGVGATNLVGRIAALRQQEQDQANTPDATNTQVGGVIPQPETTAATGVIPSGSGGNYGAFFASPDYQFRVDEGTRALTGNYAARGLLDSGALGKGLISYGQQAGSQEFGNWFSRIASLAGLGQNATNASAQLGQQNANNQAGIIQNQGANRASGYATQGGIGAGLIQNVGNTAAGLIRNIPQRPQLASNWQSSPGFVGSGGTTGLESYY